MPALIGFKPSKKDKDILDWLASQEDSVSDLIRKALRNMMDGGDGGARVPSDPIPPSYIPPYNPTLDPSFLQTFDRLASSIGELVTTIKDGSGSVPLYSNGKSKPKRKEKQNEREDPALRTEDPEATRAAFANALSMFG